MEKPTDYNPNVTWNFPFYVINVLRKVEEQFLVLWWIQEK